MTKTILQKNTEDGKFHYKLVRNFNKYVIFKMRVGNASLRRELEADFVEKIAENNDYNKIEKIFKTL